jgi:hypothetical protein
MDGSDAIPVGWSAVAYSLTRPYRVTLPMVALVMLIPLYLVIASVVRGRMPHIPALALDAVFPLQPVWALVYGSLYAFLIALPVSLVRQPAHIRRTVFAYLSIWVIAYVCFLLYPTVRAAPVAGLGRGLRRVGAAVPV